MKRFFLFAAAAVCMVLAGCNGQQGHTPSSVAQVSEPADTVVPVVEVPFREKLLTAADVTLTKDLLYDTYTLEDTYAQSQEGIESAALKLYQQNPAKAKEYLTNYTHMTAQTAVDSWKKLGEFLIVRYNDGAVKRMQNGQLQRPKTGNTAPLDRPGYSKEFLQELVKATGERYKMKELK